MISKYTKFTWIVLLSILILPTITTAQTLTNKERRNMNLKLLNAIEIYESAATLQDANAVYDFIALFENENSRIYCDLLDYSSDDNKISVSEYVKLLSNKTLVETAIKEVKKSAPIYLEDGWHTNITFQKRLNYIDENGVWFSSEEYYGADYNIIVDFVYNPQEQTCYIADINGSMHSDKEHLPNKFIVIQDSPDRPKPIYFAQESPSGSKSIDSLSFNSFDQAYINNREGLVAWSDNIHIKDSLIAQNTNYDLIKLIYKNRTLRAKMHFAYALMNTYDITLPSSSKIDDHQSAWELGLDLGATWRLARKSQMGFYTGIGFQRSSIELSFSDDEALPFEYTLKQQDNPNHNFNSQDQNSNQSCTYKIYSAKEDIEYTNLVIPAYIEFEHLLGKGIYFNWSIGAKCYLNIGTTDTYTINYDRTIEENGNLTPNSYKDQEFKDFLYPSAYLNNDFLSSISFIGFAGLDINLHDNLIFLSLKVGYEYGFADVHSSNGLDYANGINYPIIYSKEGRDIATQSLLGCAKFNRRALWGKVGLTFKF